MKRAAFLVASALLVPSAPIISASPAAADTPGFVTQQEFNQVHRGMRMSRIHQVFDTAGRVALRDAGRMHGYYKISRRLVPPADGGPCDLPEGSRRLGDAPEVGGRSVALHEGQGQPWPSSGLVQVQDNGAGARSSA